MTEKNHNKYNPIVKAKIARKPDGQVLTMRVLFGPDDIDIPEEKEVRYQVKQGQDGIITLTPEGVA